MEQDSTYINMRNISKDTTPSPGKTRQETAGGRCSITSIHLGLVAVNVFIFTLAIAIGLRVHVLLSNQKLDACQNAIERQLNRTFAESLWNQTMLEGKFQNVSATLARTSERANTLCNTFRILSGSPCPRGWKHQNPKCYKLSTEKRDWNNSKQECEFQNSHLVIINTPEEQNSIVRFIKEKKDDYWIGLTDRAEEDKWKWVDGSTVSSFDWIEGQPDDSNNEDCATISERTSPDTFGWNDDSCGRPHSFICEKWALPHINATDFEKFCS
ncbi:CD209 antigen-like protein E [Scyliorhinus canicula]|uniref:CD209 antigen-like protein E n=1 Tax=Scyliorhinus canicula TaxID=7830 RepID=UPI0018F3C8AE|nr:CD209 antigen-like protein E [Scyliorhinus canicula]